MAHARLELSTGGTTSAGRAWGTGLRLVWRYVGLWLLLIVLGIVVVAIVGLLVLLTSGAEAPPALWIVLAVLLGLPLLVLGIVVGIALSIVISYAQRAIVAQDAGPLEALRIGVRLLRARLWDSALVWLISLALTIGAGIGIAIALILPVVLLGGIGYLLWSALGFAAPTIAYVAIAVLAVIALGLTLMAVANTFFWSYWTLAYLRLRERATPAPST